MSPIRFTSTVVLTCAAFAVALSGCTSDQQTPGGVGSVDMTVTLATPPSGPNEQIDTVEVSLWCEGIDPVLGVARPPQSSPETFSINVATSQGPEPYNTIGLLEKQGLPAGNCHFSFSATSNTGNTECTGELTVAIMTNMTAQSEVVLACIHTPRYGGVRTDGTFNQCAEYRQILVTPTTQSIGNLVDVRTEVYDPDDDLVTVAVQTTGACGNVMTTNGDTAASCGMVSGCEAVVNTVECTDVGPCQITVAVSDDGFTSCDGFLPDGSNNDAARSTIAVDCTVASGCGNDVIEPGEDCEPPNTPFCDGNCQAIDPCSPDPCDQSNVCSPEVCSADANNQAVCTPDPGSAAGVMCSPPAGGTCDGQGNCVACTVDGDCEDNNDCTDNACVAGACEFTNDDTNQCTTGGLPGTCNAGVCEGLCTPDPCTSPVECVTEVCDPADGSCNPQNDGINTGCDLGGGPGSGVCDGAGACVQCNMNSQCASGESCVNNVCQAPACEYEQDFNQLDMAAADALSADGWLVFGNVFDSGGGFLFPFGPFPAPNGGPQFSAIVNDQGGPDQEPQQLSIYSAYECCPPGGHFNGTDLVQSLVFQEINPIPAALIGQVLTFTFDAKNGDIQPPTTAQAYIQTLDPNAGFSQTNFIPLDTTSIGTDWGTFSISIDLSDPLLEGQILQFGFSSTTSNFTPSQNVYDNITFGVEGCGGGNGGNGGPSGNLTVNGDFEAGDTSGWEFFPNDGTFAATMAQANGGLWSGNLVASVPGGGGPPSFPVIKQANIGIGTVQPNSTATISFDLFGSVSGAGGVFFAEFFSELSGGGTSSTVILGGGPLFPTGTWTNYTFNTPTGNDVSGGVTLQLKADCGAVAGCTVDAYIDNVSVSVP